MVGPLLVDLSRDLDVPLGQAGLLAAIMSLPWALGAPFTGLLSDRLGRRPLIVLALAGIGVASLASALAPNFPTLMATRFLAGCAGAFGPASVMAAVGDLFPAERRGMAMGWLNAGFGLAAVAGVPAVGVVGGLFGWRWAFASAGAGLLLLALLFQFGFPNPPRSHTPSSLARTYRAVLTTPMLGNVLGANLLERSIFNAAVLYLPAYLMQQYLLNAADVAPALMLVAVGTIVGNTLGGWLGDRFPKVTTFMAAQALAGAIGLSLFATAPGLVGSVVIGGAFGLTNATSRPAFLALGSELSAHHRGALLGLLSLTNQGGAVFGSAIGGLAIGLGSYTWLAWLTVCGGLGAATLAFPMRRLKT
ncbi:MAG: MFS transporter [Chloroflexi bacterium]|nr:MFS transporter [Chloroflexota bacterium]